MSVDVLSALRSCACGQPAHPGTVMRSWSPDDDAPYEAIVVQVGQPVPAPMLRALHLVALTHLPSQHRGNLLTWQADVGEPVRCGDVAEAPAPCDRAAPTCEADRAYRLAWERQH